MPSKIQQLALNLNLDAASFDAAAKMIDSCFNYLPGIDYTATREDPFRAISPAILFEDGSGVRLEGSFWVAFE